jgi:hypothetical protein
MSSFTDLEGFLHHVDDTLHPLDKIIGFGQVGPPLLAGAGVNAGRRGDLHGGRW